MFVLVKDPPGAVLPLEVTHCPSVASGIRGLVAMAIHLQLSHLVILQGNKTVWPPCLAPARQTLLPKKTKKHLNPLGIIK